MTVWYLIRYSLGHPEILAREKHSSTSSHSSICLPNFSRNIYCTIKCFQSCWDIWCLSHSHCLTLFIIGTRALDSAWVIHYLRILCETVFIWMYTPAVTTLLTPLSPIHPQATSAPDSKPHLSSYITTALRRRGATASNNSTIVIVVGVLVGMFVLVSAAFLYRYRYSVRFHKRRRRRHRHHSSRGSKTSSEGAAQPPPPPQPPPEPVAEPVGWRIRILRTRPSCCRWVDLMHVRLVFPWCSQRAVIVDIFCKWRPDLSWSNRDLTMADSLLP